MNIKILFDSIENNFLFDEIVGTMTLDGNCIIWEYSGNGYEITQFSAADLNEDKIIGDGYDDTPFDDNIISLEEHMQDIYHKDLDLIKKILECSGETDEWIFSESEIIDNVISFKIF